MLLLAETLSLQSENFHVFWGVSLTPATLTAFEPFLQRCSFSQDFYSVIEVPLRHEGLRQRDVHVDLHQLRPGYFRCQFFDFVQGQRDVLDGLFETVEAEVGLAEVVVRQDQPEIRFSVVEYEQLAQGQLLDFYVDQLLPALADCCLREIVQFSNNIPSDLVCIMVGLPWYGFFFSVFLIC